MKVTSTNLSIVFKSQIKIIENDPSYFASPFHFHPEFELVYIGEGFGKRIIGNKIDKFREGELLLIGPNVPHGWIGDKSFYGSNSETKLKATVVYFNPQIFSDFFYQMEEVAQLNKLFSQAKYGIEIKGSIKEQIIIKLKNIVNANGIDKIIQLLDILNQISISDEFYCINQQILKHKLHSSDRLTSFFNYIDANYKNNISLKDAARITNLTPESFCRYFKQRTGKNFINYLQETRVSHASQLLLNTDHTISEIAYRSGFITVSNFNKLFKKITGYRPTEYRKTTVFV